MGKFKHNKRATYIYTDGSCSWRDSRGGWGFVVYRKNKVIYRQNGRLNIKGTTAYTTELFAVMMALKFVSSQTEFIPQVRIYSDNKSVVEGLNTWIYGWMRRGWITSSGKPVKERELWQETFSYFEKVNAKISWVKGHNGVVGNEEADRLAGLGRLGVFAKSISTMKSKFITSRKVSRRNNNA